MAQPTADKAWDAAASLVCDINALRATRGLKPLRWDWRLWAGAQRLASDMAGRRYFSHVTPDGRRLEDRIMPTGYIPDSPSWLLAENLGFGTNQLATPLAIVVGWIDSPPHLENLLDPTLEDIGVGLAWGPLEAGSQSGVYYVADLGMRRVITASVRVRGRAGRTRRR